MYKVGAKFKNVSPTALNPGSTFTIGVTIDPETDNGRGEVPCIALLNDKGENYSHIIHRGEIANEITEITSAEFQKITANMHEYFEPIG